MLPLALTEDCVIAAPPANDLILPMCGDSSEVFAR